MSNPIKKRVAVVGAGPAGAITIDALVKEGTFDTIRVYERQAKAGGIWVQHPELEPKIPSLHDVIQHQADAPIVIPKVLPAVAPTDPKTNDHIERYSYTPIHSQLVSNIDARIMSYTQEPFPVKLASEPESAAVDKNAPFRKSEIIREWVDGLINRDNYRDLVEFNTTVEKAEKIGSEWVLTLRKSLPGGQHNYWWQETFDALIVASGHYSIPVIPNVPGLLELEKHHPGTVEHSKGYRKPENYKNKSVIVVGSSISAVDIATAITGFAGSIYASIRTEHRLYANIPFEHPKITIKPTISRVESSPTGNTVYFSDGSKVNNVDRIIYGTGFDFSLPWLPSAKIVNRRIQGVYLHIFDQEDPSLLYVGGVSAGFTFRVFEWQAVAVARFLAGRAKLPSLEVQKKWEQDRLSKIGDGQPFYKLAPDWAEYFETLREFAGEPSPGSRGRKLPQWDDRWLDIHRETIENKIKGWKQASALASREGNVHETAPLRARL